MSRITNVLQANLFEDAIDWLGSLWRLVVDNIWFLVATFYQGWVRAIGPYRALLIVGGAFLVVYLLAVLLQRSYVRHLEKDPNRSTIPVRRLEARYSLLMPFERVVSFYRFLRSLPQRFGRRKKDDAKAVAKGASPAPYRVATLGPTFVYSALACASVYWLARLLEPWLRSRLGLGEDASVWQFVLLGNSPYGHALLPLEDHPFPVVALVFLLWCIVWWSLANVLRATVFRHTLGANLVRRRGALPRWSDWFGAENRIRPRSAYRLWAGWTVAVAFMLLAMAWAYVDGDQDRIRPSAWAVASIVWLAWVLHLQLAGKAEGLEAPRAEGDETEPACAGWPEVLEDLRSVFGLRLEGSERAELMPSRALQGLNPRRDLSVQDGVLSPMTFELLSGVLGAQPAEGKTAKLTEMQFDVLYRLSRMAYVHLDPPATGDALALSDRERGGPRDESGLRRRHQVVRAPEGAGKTTLALLAAANHALVHTSTSLLIVRRNDQAKATYEALRSRIDRSTARWNLRVRRIGGDFVNDLTQRIIPDLVICSLDQLVVDVLDNVATYRPFLEHVGLIVVDDVEEFAGDAEIHAQLAFRRLNFVLRRLAGPSEEEEEVQEPTFLVLGTDSMHQSLTWVNTLCNIDSVLRPFEPPENAAIGTQNGTATEPPAEETNGSSKAAGGEQLFYSLNAFRVASPRGERRIRPREIVESCERLGVPWAYRPCGDERRHLGSENLLLQNAAVHEVANPAAAEVILLEGTITDVRREVDRLRFAGLKAPSQHHDPPKPIACVAIVDPDEETVYRASEKHGGLRQLWRTLPRPVLRPPSSLTTHTHLASDLLQHWLEVADVIGVYGASTAQRLRQLERQGLLVTEQRMDVQPKANEFERKLYLRALAGAVSMDEEEAWRQGLLDDDRVTILTKVAQVDLVSPRVVDIRDRTNLQLLRRTDADSAALVYYPGRIFESAKGRFVVVEQQRRGGENEGGGVEVEPILDDYVSSPRRQVRADAPSHPLGDGDGDREPLLLGQYAFDVELRSVRLTVTPVATVHLAPVSAEIQRRQLFENEKRRRYRQELSTRAYVLYPRSAGTPPEVEVPHELSFGGARLLAATLRLLLSTIYRGVRDGVDVAVILADEEGAPRRPKDFDELLDLEDGIYLFDLHTGGSGAVAAIARDGVGLLLRMARQMLKEVSDLRRLLRLHDLWGDRGEVIHPKLIGLESVVDRAEADAQESESPEATTEAAEAGDGVGEGEPEPAAVTAPAAVPQERIEAARRSALGWLDSRLEPEIGFFEAGETDDGSSEVPEVVVLESEGVRDDGAGAAEGAVG